MNPASRRFRPAAAPSICETWRAASSAAQPLRGRDRLPHVRPCLSGPRRHPRGDRPPLRPQPDRRGVLRRPGLGRVPALGAGLPDPPGGRAQGADGDPPPCPRARTDRVRSCLEVGIGDGENLAFLPPGGPSTASTSPGPSSRRAVAAIPEMAGRLAWAEAENLPFDDATFDACWSIGGFNYLPRPRGGPARDAPGDQARRPGRRRRRGPRPPSRRAGTPARRPVASMPGGCACWGSTASSSSMVLEFDVDLIGPGQRVWPEAVRHRIWHGLGYCLVDHVHLRR